MTRPIIAISIFLLSSMLASQAGILDNKNVNPYNLQDGDLVFQSGKTAQDKAVMAATGSKWSHVGVVFFHEGSPWVLEAVQPVKTTTLTKFISRCPDAFYAMRLRNSHLYLNNKNLLKAHEYAQTQIGKPYDPYFQWSEDRVYCSELIWKIYKEAAGIELCKPRLLSSYNLHHPTVQKLINKRYGSMSKLPMNELVVAPSDLALSDLLVEAPVKLGRVSKKQPTP